jgi:hypothetical protein
MGWAILYVVGCAVCFMIGQWLSDLFTASGGQMEHPAFWFFVALAVFLLASVYVLGGLLGGV